MNVQIKRYNRRCARREAALLNRNNAVCARMAALSDPPDTGNVEDIALYRKLKAFGAAKAAEYTALWTFLNAGPRLRGPTVNFQEWVIEAASPILCAVQRRAKSDTDRQCRLQSSEIGSAVFVEGNDRIASR